jgi:hypothetical protein
MPTMKRVATICGQGAVAGAAISANADGRVAVRGMALFVGA